jgi:hypothetical protein
MKKSTFIFFIFVIGTICQCAAQKNSYGFSVGVGKGAILKEALVGGPSYDLNLGYSIGFQFNRKLTNRLEFNTGVTWYSNQVSVTPNFYPGIDRTAKNYNVQLLYVPIFLKTYVSKYIFLNGGFIGDIDVTQSRYITSQSGVGAGLGIGGRVSVSKNMSMELNPYLNFHGLFLANSDLYPERVLDSGVKLSVIFQ